MEYIISIILSVLTYFFFLEEYNYPGYASFGVAIGVALIGFIISDDIRRYRKERQERKWQKYRERVFKATYNDDEDIEKHDKIKPTDYDFLFSISKNDINK